MVSGRSSSSTVSATGCTRASTRISRRPTRPRPRLASSVTAVFEPTAEQREIVAAVREFVEREVKPTVSELEHADEFPEALVGTMRELGLLGATIPAEYGGLGLDVTTYALIVAELSRGWM